MNTREQFGKYLLLKKLTEDPMGETFRAGLLGDKGMEQVALLRIFNGQGLDGNRLWQAVESRAAVQDALKSPNIGEGIEVGQLEGIPYVAYDYVSGKNMAKLLEQAAKKRNFLPAEHALLITERIALALATAAETRFGGDRIYHGFVVPHLTVISNEGETRLLGFELGPGLRSFSQNPVIRQHFGRYLSPEALTGADPHPLDDIYSLGVILYELLTGRPLPPPGQDGFMSVIDQGVVATEGTPIAPPLAALLKQSLVPREQRVKDVATWHKTLNTYMFEGQYNPTTFNLAFFMHNLFRQEIERESQEIEAEKTLPVPTVREATSPGVEAPAPAPVPDAPVDTPPAVAADEKTENFIPDYAKEEKKSSKAGLIGGILAALLLLGLGGFFLLGGDKDEKSETEVAQAAAPPPAEPEYTGPSEDEIKKQIEELVSQQSNVIQQQYDETLADLQSQLETAQKEADRRRREAEAAEQRRQEEEAAAAQAAEDAKQAEEEAARKEAEEAAAKEAEEAAAAAKEEEKIAEAAPPPPPPPQAPPKPQVRRGDLVELGPGVKLPVATRPVKPRYPDMAKRFNKNRATVVVKVLIDENGEVLKAELAGPEQKFGFDTEAIQAAKRSQWKPATKNGVPVKIWHTLSIEFRQ